MTRVAPRQWSAAARPVTATCLRIGRHTLRADGEVFIIAEAGVNHNGDEAAALRLVDAAAEAGADAVKFQLFHADTLATATAPAASYQVERSGITSQQEMLRELELPLDSFRRIAERAAERGIAFLATPFTEADVAPLAKMGSVAVKIASTDLVDVALLERACDSGLPLILSTGAADEREIAEAVQRIEDWGARDRLALMHCVSAYPTGMDQANLRAIKALQDRFSTVVGFSDHTTSTRTGGLAVAAGATILEKHFTLDATGAGPDHSMSLERAALTEYIALAREAGDALGSGSLSVQPVEEEVRRVGRKSIVAARDICTGERLTADMLTFRRAGVGLLPTELPKLLGKPAKVSIETDTPVVWDMLGT